MAEKDLNFEEKIEAAKKIMEELMDPQIPLEKSVRLYEEGMKLLKEAGRILEEAKIEIETIEKGEVEEGKKP